MVKNHGHIIPRASLRELLRDMVADLTGLLVVDVWTPTAPVQVGRWSDFSAAPLDVAVSITHAFVTDANLAGMLWVVDITNPANPVWAGDVALYVDEWPGTVTLMGDLALVGGLWGWDTPEGLLHVVDVSVPSSPVTVGNLPRPGVMLDVALADGLAVTLSRVSSHGEVSVVDVTVPISPVELGSITVPAGAGRVWLGGHRAYVANSFGGVRVIDVSDPQAPHETGAFVPSEPGLQAVDLALGANHAFVADSFGGGLRVVNVANPLWPHEVGRYELWNASGLTVRDGLAYLATGNGGLMVLDVSDCVAELFSDGFESGNGAAWPLVVE